MTLAELAFSCACYDRSTDYDKSYLDFLQSTDGAPDLSKPQHRKFLLIWLNQWGCCQFAVEFHKQASTVLRRWGDEFMPSLFPSNKDIWELSESDFGFISKAYTALVTQTASLRKVGQRLVPVTFGPTGVSKILFALRRNVFVPWDIPIRRHFGYDDSAESYINYLRSIIAELKSLEQTCIQCGFQIEDLPSKLERPDSSIPKLIDEYNWLTITNGWGPPTPQTFKNWAAWC